jgi:hypothetical protein
VALVAGVLAFNRLLISPVLADLALVGGLVLLVTAVLRLALWLIGRSTDKQVGRVEAATLLTIVASALFVRLIATAHPQMDIIDLGFHVNRFSDVAERGMLFLKIRSAEWGGRETIYSPAAYLAMIPLHWVVDDKHTLIRLFTALLETSRALIVFALARWVTQRATPALLATTLFVALPIAVLPFSWGITSNLFGEWWATLLLLVLTVWWHELGRPWPLLLASVTAALALLAHPGDLLLTGGALGLLTLGLLATVVWSRGPRRVAGYRLASVVAITIVASGLAFGLFYRVDAATMLSQGSATLGARIAGETPADQPRRWRVSGSVDDKTLGIGARYVTEWQRVPVEGAVGYLREAWAYYWLWPLPAAVAGWLALSTVPRGRAFRSVSLAWVGSAIVFALVGLLVNLYVRYMLFLLPVVALLAGVALDRLSRWGPWGRVATIVLVGATVVAGFWLWHQRVVYFFH